MKATSGQRVTDGLCGDSRLSQDVVFRPLAAAANGTRTEADHARETHTCRMGVRVKAPSAGSY